eukprot:gene21560-biopygen7440
MLTCVKIPGQTQCRTTLKHTKPDATPNRNSMQLTIRQKAHALHPDSPHPQEALAGSDTISLCFTCDEADDGGGLELSKPQSDRQILQVMEGQGTVWIGESAECLFNIINFHPIPIILLSGGDQSALIDHLQTEGQSESDESRCRTASSIPFGVRGGARGDHALDPLQQDNSAKRPDLIIEANRKWVVVGRTQGVRDGRVHDPLPSLDALLPMPEQHQN